MFLWNSNSASAPQRKSLLSLAFRELRSAENMESSPKHQENSCIKYWTFVSKAQQSIAIGELRSVTYRPSMNALVIEQSLLQSHFLVGNLVLGHILNKHKEREMRGEHLWILLLLSVNKFPQARLKSFLPQLLLRALFKAHLGTGLSALFAGDRESTAESSSTPCISHVAAKACGGKRAYEAHGA